MSLHSGAPERPRIINEEDRPGPPPLMSDERSKGKGLTLIAAGLAVAAFAGVVWYAYDQGRRIGSESAAPLIKADTNPTKVRPESPGGMQIPHQDKLVLDDLGSGSGASSRNGRVERLLPPPETPLPQPEPLPTPQQQQADTSAPPSASVVIPPAKKPVPEAPKAIVPPTTAQAPATTPAAPVVPPAPKEVAAAETKPAPKPAAAPAQTAAATPAPKAPAPAVGDFNIQIAALRSQDAAEKEWSRVQNGNKALLAALEPAYQRITTENGVFFRVQGGPLTEAAARQVCAALKAKGQACLVVKR